MDSNSSTHCNDMKMEKHVLSTRKTKLLKYFSKIKKFEKWFMRKLSCHNFLRLFYTLFFILKLINLNKLFNIQKNSQDCWGRKILLRSNVLLPFKNRRCKTETTYFTEIISMVFIFFYISGSINFFLGNPLTFTLHLYIVVNIGSE